ncbi:MipA/OmpV family protein [uncultured Sphingomonas sp.]|uniref:MipA/OmpV family protein n=1 Tax=uncultured Sphingomonas sp. TaxID=158754 RepID=UPI0035CAB169
MRHLLRSAAMAVAAGLAAPALAQNAPAASPPDAGAAAAAGGDSLTIGAGGAYLPDYEGSDHNHWRPAPGAIGSFHGFNFTLAGNRLSIDLIPSKPGPTWDVELGPVGVVNFNRTSTRSIGDPRIKALGKVDTAIELGGYAGIGKTGVITSDYDRLSVSLSYRHDVSGVHDGAIISPSINYLTPLSRKIVVGIFASAEHADDGYAQTYYSVSAPQTAVSGLPTYAAHGGWKNYTLGALGAVSITGDLTRGFKLVGGGTYARLLNSFSYSPVTRVAGDPNQWLGIVGLAYTF